MEWSHNFFTFYSEKIKGSILAGNGGVNGSIVKIQCVPKEITFVLLDVEDARCVHWKWKQNVAVHNFVDLEIIAAAIIILASVVAAAWIVQKKETSTKVQHAANVQNYVPIVHLPVLIVLEAVKIVV